MFDSELATFSAPLLITLNGIFRLVFLNVLMVLGTRRTLLIRSLFFSIQSSHPHQFAFSVCGISINVHRTAISRFSKIDGKFFAAAIRVYLDIFRIPLPITEPSEQH